MKIANIDREFPCTFWTTWGNSMKFSGKMYLKIILKVTKNQGFTLSLEDKFFKNHRGVKLPPPLPAVLGLKPFFKDIFLDLKIAKAYTCGETKASWILSGAITPELQETLVNQMKTCCFSIATDQWPPAGENERCYTKDFAH